MTIKKEKKGDLMVYYVDKLITDAKMETLKNTYVKPSQIKLIIDHDADVFSEDGKLLIRFRKNKLDKAKIEDFYENVIDFAKQKTTNRGSTTGSKEKTFKTNPPTMTNIIGFFDTFSPSQKILMAKRGQKLLSVRECRFNMDHPEKYKKLLPLVKEIDEYYQKYVPENYGKQRKKANQTPFKIDGTSFTTITTNVNFRTSIHKDKGDDAEGFGNLSVIEKGKYSGAETCLPQYGVGVDVRAGDVLYMDVHEWHGNLPMKNIDKDATRLSIVCYLRHNIWDKSKNKTKKFAIKHNKSVKNLRGAK